MSEEAQRQFSILLVDDEPNILNALKRLFRRSGYVIHTAESGAAGLEILRQQPVDLIISDMRMPEMNGAEFLEQAVEVAPEAMRLLLTGYSDINATIEAINKGKIFGYISKPWNETELNLTVRQALEQKALRDERDRLQKLTQKQNAELKELNATLEDKVRQRTKQLRLAHKRLKESYFASIPVFASLVRLREEGGAEGHSKRVADHARAVAERLGLDADQVRDIYFAGLLHDIGKITLPDEIAGKSEGEMTFPERDRYRKHTQTAESILMTLEPLQNTAHIIAAIHEQYNGKGYPKGLKGEEIPLGARILALANDYDKLIHGQLLGEKLSAVDAIAWMRQSPRYDPYLLTEFIQVLESEGETEGSVRELRLRPDALKEGMILSRNLLNSDGMMLLAKGYVLREPMLSRIKQFGMQEGDHFVIHVEADRMEEVD